MPDVKQVASDPNFRNLDPKEQRKVLVSLDPNFAALPDEEKDKARLGLLAAHPPAPKRSLPKIDFGTNDPLANFGREAGSKLLEAGTNALAQRAKEDKDPNYGLAGKGGLSPIAATKEAFKSSYDTAKRAVPGTGIGAGIERGIAFGDAFLGGDPESSVKNDNEGNHAAALADLITVPGATIGSGKMLGETTPTVPTDFKPYSPQVQAAESMAGKTIRDEASWKPGYIHERVTPDLRQGMRDELKSQGRTEGDLHRTLPSSNGYIAKPKVESPSDLPVQKGIRTINSAVDRAVKTKEGQFQQILTPYEGQPFDAKYSAGRLRNAASQYEEMGAPKLAIALKDLATRLEGIGTIKDANEMRKVLNDLSDKIYNSPASQIADLQAADANRRAADIIRGDLYDTLGSMSDLDPAMIKKLQRAHGDLLQWRDAFQDRINGLSPDQAYYDTTPAAKRIIRGRSAESSVSVGKMVKRALEKSEYGEINASARKMFENLGEGGTPSKFVPEDRTNHLRLEASNPNPEPVGVHTSNTRVTPADVPSSQDAGVQSVKVTPSTRQKQLPPIAGATASTEGAEETTGGVFPNREVRVDKMSGPGRFRATHHVTDWVGSGAGPEAAARPGTARGMLAITSKETAAKALEGYDTFKNSDRYKALDVDAKNKFDEDYKNLKAFADQGEVGPPKNQKGPTTTVSQYAEPKDLPASEIFGKDRGQHIARTPEDAQRQIDAIDRARSEGIDPTKGMTREDKEKFNESYAKLKKLAAQKSSPRPGTPLPRLREVPGTEPTRMRQNKLLKRGVQSLPAIAADQRDDER